MCEFHTEIIYKKNGAGLGDLELGGGQKAFPRSLKRAPEPGLKITGITVSQDSGIWRLYILIPIPVPHQLAV